MEENNKKKNKTKVVVITCIIVAILLGIGGAHVYASTHGYGNVFFLIKYLVTGEKPEITDKNELLSDRDITLSYEPINLTENIKIQIRNIQIKDNKAKLVIGVSEKEKNNTTPLKYKVYNESDKLICDYEGKTQEDSPSEYIEDLMLNEFKNDDKILKLEIYNAQNEKLTRIIINLETREITVEDEKEAVNKISEIELKRFLESISALEKYKNSDDEKILFVKSEIASNENLKANGELFDEVNKMLEATGYEKLSNPLKNADYFKITNKNGTNYIEVTEGREGFEPNKVIEIKSISYCGGIYTVNFTYTFIHPSDEFNTDTNDLEIEEATAYIKLNEDKTYSTFKVVKYEKDNNNSNQEKELSEPSTAENNYNQFNTKLYGIKDIALEWRDINNIKNYKDFIFDFDGDGSIDKLTVKSEKNGDDREEYYVELNGNIVIEKTNKTLLSRIYIVDLNKNDNKIEIIIENDGGSDDPKYEVYTKNKKGLIRIVNEAGFNLQTNQQGVLVAETVITKQISPIVFKNYFEFNNGVANKKETNIKDIKDITFTSENLYFTQDMNNIMKYIEKENKENNKLEDSGIYKGKLKFKILRFDDTTNINSFYVKLDDGREGYIFPAAGYLAG